MIPLSSRRALRGLVVLVLGFSVFVERGAAVEGVVWTSLVNAEVNGTTLQRTGCEWCRGGAVSAQSIGAGDGYVEFTVAEVATQRAAGLSNGNTDTTVSDIDFAVWFNGAGSAEVRENGTYRWGVSYASGDVFRVAIVANQVKYSKNGVVFYTSLAAPSYPILVDASLGSLGSTISAAVFSSDGGEPPPPPPPPPSEGGFEVTLFAGGLTVPTAMEFAPDGRLFVAEQSGRVRVIKDGALLATPFATVAAQSSFEQGLLGVTFDPNFAINGYVYVYYTALGGQDRVSRFTASTTNSDVAAPGSELVILDNILQSGGYHDGGAIHFGADSKLYVGVGDGGSSSNAQSLSSLGGKLLRIDPSAYPNIIPPDNPFVLTPGARGEIWALGLRNPFTFAVQPGTGKIHINDVGESTWEEINLGSRGANYGWPACEGPCSNPNFVSPIYVYNHNAAQAAITGGTFYEADQFPSEYRGSYFFADYLNGFIRRLDSANQPLAFLEGAQGPVDLKVGPDGSLYYLSIFDHVVYRIRFVSEGNRNPIAVASANPTSGVPPLEVDFNGSGSSDPDGDTLTYVWDFGDGSPTQSGANVTHTYASSGSFDAVLTVDDGRGGSASATVTINVGAAPTGQITQPVEGTTYDAGNTIFYEGTATDPEDGALPPSAFSWTIRFHHLDHSHAFQGPINGTTSGSFTIPRSGHETDHQVWYRIYLTVTDSSGLTHVSTRDVLPNTSTVTFDTNPSGLQLALDGQPFTSPASKIGVVGMIRTLAAPSPQTVQGKSYEFVSWSDAGGQTHTIEWPATDSTYTATFREVVSGPEDVIWTSLVNAVVNGTTLQRAGCEWCRGGAISSQTITAGDGFVEFTIAEVATQRAAGLSNGNTDTTVADIDFAVSVNGSGSAEVRENDIYRWDIAYASGDVFRVAVVGNQVRYSKNGVVFYTSFAAPTYPLLMDASLGQAGSTISGAMISRGQ